ncbi:hypothetical protein BJV78DRAFT_1288889 [Lactifluus subvellereus]|nr:hypothetical protein BJV78DRAFT_1288889 [Lactifluus subvellereus]
MKLIERADVLMQQAQMLYEQHEHWMKPDDRILAEDRMTIASDFMRCAKEKSLLTRAEPAKLYLDRAQEALETVKGAVDATIEIRKRKEGSYE